MTLRRKLIVMLALVALLPVGVSAFLGVRVHRSAFERQVSVAQRGAARFGAALADETIASALTALGGLGRAIPWSELDAHELEGALLLVYQQLDDVLAVQLFDNHGRALGPSVTGPNREASKLRPLLSAKALAELRPAAASSRVGRLTYDSGLAFMPLWVPVGPERRWMLAIGLSLDRTCAALAAAEDDGRRLLVVDGQSRAVCDGSAVGRGTEVETRAGEDGALRLADESRVGQAATSRYGLRVIAHDDVQAVERSSKRLRDQALFWVAISLLVALSAGLILARAITAPVRVLTEGADQLAGGNLAHRIELAGRDELAQLAASFNRMAEQLEQRDAEIRGWNKELRDRVDQRTRELEDAQAQVLASQKIAAVSSLAAGVAHEINNPLAGVLGIAQVLKLKSAPTERPLLETIEAEARRIRDIVSTLQSFSADYRGEGMVELEIGPIIERAAELVRRQIEQKGVELEIEVEPGVPPVRGIAPQLEQALVHVLDNARIATDRGRVRIAARGVGDGAVRVVVSDTGGGIAPRDLDRVLEPFFTTKKEWQGRGLGLTVAYRIVEQHRGSMKITSAPGEGTTVAISLPASGGASHLV